MMSDLTFTSEQNQAIETIDRSVLVSAAAGSGKTAVLAERCAYLVCDAPPEQRCDIDQLVVVTFTENAAAEMKARIRSAMAARLRRRPHDRRLRDQLALIDNARISTLHAFGLWILRRWFSQAGIDPAAPVLDAHEAALLRSETLERLLEQLYREDSELSTGFRKLIDDYGLGNDRAITRFLQQLAGFLESLPDPQDWLTRCRAWVTTDRQRLLKHLATDLADELEGQADYCRRAARHIKHRLSDFAFYGAKLDEAVALLEEWRADLHTKGSESDIVQSLRLVQAALGAHKFLAKGAPRLAKDAPVEVHERREQARQLYNHFNSQLFNSRLKRVFGRFAPEEWYAGLERIAPYVEIVTQLLERYRRDYAQTKSDVGVLDFGDLERKTYDLLVGHADVAATLRQRFRHVLVDEFQDINPLQEAIIRLVSREPDDDHPDNLFVVGDVKQSIYRFRLADPAIFLERAASLSDENTAGTCIYLQRNYRSAPHIIAAVNHLFRRLLTRHLGGIEYDASAELRLGPEADASARAGQARVELHLLQRRPTIASDTETEFVDPHDPAEWSAIEREAYVIARRIREIVNDDAGRGGTMQERTARRDGSPPGYGDIAVLLRAAAHTAAPMAQMLGALGIPACADVGGEFFDALEVRDILSLLSVLDNMRQDIPLAAVLRSPVLGDALNENELLELRMTARDVPFHETVTLYAATGRDPKLRERVARLCARIDRHRSDARQRPLSETLWRIYHENGYLAYLGGLPNGAGRRANLLKLHEYARKFGTFQKQGLHRFLRFIESLKEQDQDLDVASPPSAPENVVRVMSIHRSKGLEFPVVVLADLGRRFNLTDAVGRLIFDRELGVGLRVVDGDRMIEYPSLAHHLVAGCVNKHTRAEELRILYVALTRAMQRLILVGSADLPGLRRAYALHMGSQSTLSRLTVSTAATPLDWVVPALATLPPDTVSWHTPARRDPRTASSVSDGADTPSRDRKRAVAPQTSAGVFEVHTYEEDEMSGWTLEVSASASENPARRAAAELLPLPTEEPVDAADDVVDPILERLTYVYPNLAAASVPAVVAATEIRKRYDWLRDPDERPSASVLDRPQPPPAKAPDTGTIHTPSPKGVSAAEVGLVTHRFLQHLDLRVPPTADSLRQELQRLIAAGILAPSDTEVIDIEAVAWFLGTKLGNRIRRGAADYRREVMFVHRRPAAAIDPLVSGTETPTDLAGGGADEPGDAVLVRGVIDGVLPGESGVEIIEYKTDRITPAEIDQRIRSYAHQLSAYAAAAEALFDRPVEKSWLVFLEARVIVDALRVES